jgi:hypothetical protein
VVFDELDGYRSLVVAPFANFLATTQYTSTAAGAEQWWPGMLTEFAPCCPALGLAIPTRLRLHLHAIS